MEVTDLTPVIAKELTLLPELERVVVALRILEGLTASEVAQVLCLPEDYIGRLEHQAQTRLRWRVGARLIAARAG